MLSRVIYGARLSLPLALLLVSLAILVGGVLGAIAGYFRSLPDAVVMRTVDLVFAFPAIILAMVVTASLGPNVRNAVLAIVIVSWPAYARVVRGLVLSLGDSEFVQASRLLGSSSRRALVRDILPNLAGPVVVLGTLDLANAILLLSGLSFLGLGAQPPTPEWGSMVAVGTQNFQYWWVGTFPGLAIFSAVLAFNFLGDSLRDRFDPRGHAREPGGDARERLLEVEGLRVTLPSGSRALTVVDGVDYEVEDGRVFGIAGESGSGKTVSVLALMGLLPSGAARRGGALRRRRSAVHAAEPAPAGVRARDRARLPGPADVVPPDALGRAAADRARAPASEGERQGGAAAGDGAARGGPHPRPRAGARLLPAPVLGRDAPADRDRLGARVRADAADRGRADDRARRDRAGGDHAPARPAAPGPRALGGPDHARPRGHVGDRGRARDLLRRPHRRARCRQGRPAGPAAPVHARAARRAAASGAPERLAAAVDRRRAAAAREPAARVRLPSPLRLRAGDCSQTVPPLLAAGGRSLACHVDPFAE